MINSNKRLVVFSSSKLEYNPKGRPGSLFNDQKAFIFETDWDYKNAGQLQNDNKGIIGRGRSNYEKRNESPRNKLWLMWHFVTKGTGGSKGEAKKVNKAGVVNKRLLHYKTKHGLDRSPNFLVVDFYEHGKDELLGKVKEFNKIHEVTSLATSSGTGMEPAGMGSVPGGEIPGGEVMPTTPEQEIPGGFPGQEIHGSEVMPSVPEQEIPGGFTGPGQEIQEQEIPGGF